MKYVTENKREQCTDRCEQSPPGIPPAPGHGIDEYRQSVPPAPGAGQHGYGSPVKIRLVPSGEIAVSSGDAV